MKYGLEHWGSDEKGISTTRRFLLEFQSFLYRYIPVGIVHQDLGPVKLNWRPPRFCGRDELETLMASEKLEDWVELTIRAGLPPPEEDFQFNAKHKSNSYVKPEDLAKLGQKAPDDMEAQG